MTAAAWEQRAVTLLGLAVALSAIVLCVVALQPVPAADSLAFLLDLHRDGLAQTLWRQTEEHRPALLRLMILADQHAGGGNAVTLAVILGGQAAALAALAALLRPKLGAMTAPAAAIMAALVFWLVNVSQFVYPFLGWVPLVTSLAVIAFVGLARHLECGHPAWLAAALAAAAAGSFCGVSGLFIWAVLAALAGSRRAWRTLAAVTVAAGLLAALYFAHYARPAYGGQVDLLMVNPIVLTELMARFVGAPFGAILSFGSVSRFAPALGLAFGLAGLAAAAFQGVRFLAAGRRASAGQTALAGLQLFVLMWAGAVTIKHAQGGTFVLLDRFLSPACWFWAAQVAAACLAVAARPRLRRAFCATALLGMVAGLPVHLISAVTAQSIAIEVGATGTALAAGVADPALERRQGYQLALGAVAHDLRDRRLPPFDHPAALAVAAEAPAAWRTPLPACAGAVEGELRLAEDGWKLWGQWRDAPSGARLAAIAETGLVAGHGQTWRPPFRPNPALSWPLGDRSRFLVYAAGPRPARLVGVDGGGAPLCAFAL